MVLADLGKRINNALQQLNKAPVIDEELLNQVLKEIQLALLQSDVNVKYVAKLKSNIIMKFKMEDSQGVNLKKMIQQAVVQELTQMLDSNKKPFVPKRGKPNVVMFVGLQGAGKTTTCTKYAYHWQKKGWRTALICADTFRAGAFDQLKQNATKVRVPFYGSYSETDPVAIAEEGVKHFKKENYEMIIVDTSGRHKQESELFDEMKQVQAAVNPDECIFVMDGSIGQACYDQAQAFRNAVNVGSVIITKLDGHAKGGGALSAVAATESPIIFIGTGEHFEDLEPFNPESFVKRLLGLGDIKGMITTVTEAVDMETQGKAIANITKGQFSIRDFQAQYKSILKLGSINQFMSMIPGMGNSILDKNNEKESIRKVKKFLTIMDSMNDNELDGIVPINPSRVVRIARGSGSSLEDVNQLLDEYKKIAKVFIGLGKGFGKGGDIGNIMRNPNQIKNQMGAALDPKMIQGMGGMGNIMNMVKEMSKMEGVGDLMKGLGGGNMAEMMKSLGGNIPGLSGLTKKRR
ncbi:hypothetical protein ABPG72_020301 [Tetrahymena utriculariae]